MLVVEAQTIGKGNPLFNEDAIVITDDFIAVIDGATAKTMIDTIFPGQIAAATLAAAIPELPATVDAYQAVDILTSAMNKAHPKRAGAERPSASILLVSVKKREVWVVGDGAVCVNGSWTQYRHRVEHYTASARAAYLVAELQSGVPREVLLEHDTGRAFITVASE